MTHEVNIKLLNNSIGQPVYQYITNDLIKDYYICTITEKSLMYYLHSKMPDVLFMETTAEHRQNLWRNWLFNQITDANSEGGKKELEDYNTQHDNRVNVCIRQLSKDDIQRMGKQIIQKAEDGQHHYFCYFSTASFYVKIWNHDLYEDSEEIVEIFTTKIKKILEDVLGTTGFEIVERPQIIDQANTTGHEMQINFSISFYKFIIEKKNLEKFDSVFNTLIADIRDYNKNN